MKRQIQLLSLALLLPQLAVAQTPSPPTSSSPQRADQARAATLPHEAALRLEQQRIEAMRKQLFQQAVPASSTFPNVGKVAPSALDVETIAARYGALARTRRVDGAMVFASLSMPTASLHRLLVDSHRAGIVVVLRGFPGGSIRSAAGAVRALGVESGHVQVNPAAFAKYRVSAVPTLVLVKAGGGEQLGADGCVLPENYVKLAGDVTLAHALDEIGLRSVQFAPVAARLRLSLEGRTP